MSRVIERVVLTVALAAACGAIYLALDARSVATDAQAAVEDAEGRSASLRRELEAFKPTLVVQQRSDNPFEAPRVPSGEFANVSIGCPDGSVAVGGGFNGFDGVTIAGSTPSGGNGGSAARGDSWLVNAVNDSGGRGRIAPAVLCARGEGGLRVRSTMDSAAKATIGP